MARIDVGFTSTLPKFPGYNLRMSNSEKKAVGFWAAVIVPFAVTSYLVSMVIGQALVQRALVPRWLAHTIEALYLPLGWLIGLID